MTTREFVQHILMNADLDDKVEIEVTVPANTDQTLFHVYPAHVTKIGDTLSESVTLIECKPYNGGK